jgi:hypothetical protein
MALPKITLPIYELNIPSTKKVMKYHPFLVKDQKALLIAQNSEDVVVMYNTLKDCIKSCSVNDIDTNKLAMFDIEYIFSQIRAKSIGEIADVHFQCLQCNDPKAVVKVSIDLTKLQVEFDPNHTNNVKLTDTMIVKMSYPSPSTVKKLKSSEYSVPEVFDAIIECMEIVYDADTTYSASEQSMEEKTNFVCDLTIDAFGKLEQFFLTIPELTQTIEFTCPVCSAKHIQTLRGLSDFF